MRTMLGTEMSRLRFEGIIGQTRQIKELFRHVYRASESSDPVLILGETGTGKELVARAIHFSGSRQRGPFVPLDCGAVPSSLAESELFGYQRGAFTGAERNRDGMFAAAHGGSIFMDEIGDLPLILQTRLLRVIQEREIRPLGSTQSSKIDVRVIAATNRDLEAALRERTFRTDLYHRLSVIVLRVPPLRERKPDIPLLAQYVMDKLATEGHVLRQLPSQVLDAYFRYDWPGNIRELENCILRGVALSAHDELQTEAFLPTTDAMQLTGSSIEPGSFRAAEANAIAQALLQVQGNKVAAARILGIGKTTLYRRLKQFNLSLVSLWLSAL
jgi:transcriptional regulator with PAS, ATPase and Fis domain